MVGLCLEQTSGMSLVGQLASWIDGAGTVADPYQNVDLRDLGGFRANPEMVQGRKGRGGASKEFPRP